MTEQQQRIGGSTVRTDIHRPSAINPEDYVFVGCEAIKIRGFEDAEIMRREREIIDAHMEKTGGTYSRHAHGGNCMVCGNANAIYTVLFYHPHSNSYVRMGQDCAEKTGCNDPAMFRRLTLLRDGIARAREFRAGKEKARNMLADAGLSRAWDIYDSDATQWEETTIRDIVGKLVRYGSISDKQTAFVAKLLEQIDTRADREAKRADEYAQSSEVPVTDKRVTVDGTVLSIKVDEYYGNVRMLLQHVDGFKLWGTRPSSLADVERGHRVQFDAKIQRSDRDPKFGFFSRPTKAKLIGG